MLGFRVISDRPLSRTTVVASLRRVFPEIADHGVLVIGGQLHSSLYVDDPDWLDSDIELIGFATRTCLIVDEVGRPPEWEDVASRAFRALCDAAPDARILFVYGEAEHLATREPGLGVSFTDAAPERLRATLTKAFDGAVPA